MPPPRPSLLLGVDGCRGGWIYAAQKSEGPLSFGLAQTLEQLLELAPAAVAIDMPIGLSEGPRAVLRSADLAVRRLLGPRRASVFAPPTRWMLSQPHYLPAKQPGLSVQAFHLGPKIAALDRLLRLQPGLPWFEAHPELAFAQLAGDPLKHNKRSAAGQAERRRLLLRHAGPHLPGLRSSLTAAAGRWKRSEVAIDDLHDALVLLLVARAVAAGRAACWPNPPERDAQGLRIAIHGLPLKSAQPEDPRHQRILATVDSIPQGQVATYGQVAAEAGLPGRARLVARLLASLPAQTQLPWWRVLASPGQIAARAPAAMARQSSLLRAEGLVLTAAGRLDLERFRWRP